MSKKFWSFRKNPSPAIKVDKSELKKRLTPIQYRVTQEAATERPFSGEYLKLKENGMYACVVCGEELFSSSCKYESGCGWPAFYDAEDENKLIYKPDLSHVGGNIILLALKPDLVRTEVTCGNCGAHLGHVFDDGPKPTGKRYCINSASLKFNRISNTAADEAVNEKKQSSERISSQKAESDKCQKDVINSTTDATCNSNTSVPLTAASKFDQRKAVGAANSKPDPVIRSGALDSFSASSSQRHTSAMSSVTHAEEEVNTKVGKRSATGIFGDRMRFFTSQRDAMTYKGRSSKIPIESGSEERKELERRRCTTDPSTTENADASIRVSHTDCRPKTTTTTCPHPPRTTSTSKSPSLRSSWFSAAAAASPKELETASVS